MGDVEKANVLMRNAICSLHSSEAWRKRQMLNYFKFNKNKNPPIKVDNWMPRRGLEPPTREGHTPQACAYASSATGAWELKELYHYTVRSLRVNSRMWFKWNTCVNSVILHLNYRN